jgi:SAM-dependent methyltransferase
MVRPRDERASPGAEAVVEILSAPQSSGFPEEWYELGDPGHFWFEWRLRGFLRQARDLGLPFERPLRMLDVGAGTGVLRDQLEARTAWTVDVADINTRALARARRGRGRTLCYDVLAPAAELLARYDAALLFDVLEHVADTRPFVEAVSRHLRPGGHLLVNVPAGQWLFGSYDVAAGHVRRYGRATLAAELATAGLEVRDVRYWGLSLVPLLLARKGLVRTAPSPDACVRRGFEPPGRLAHALLRAAMRAETAVLRRPLLGSSLLLAARRPCA